MYIRERGQLGDNTASKPKRMTLAMRPKPFLNLDRFRFNKHLLTDRLMRMVDEFGNSVIASWKSTKPIEVIRLIGHTDSTGSERYNVNLGGRRARAVEAALKDKLKGLSDRVTIVVERSPGETQPVAENKTADGRDRNRRVEVFVKTGVLPPPSPPTKPTGKFNPWDWSKITPPAEPIIRTTPDPIFQRIPAGPKGQSLESWLNERLSGISSKWLRGKIRNAVLSGACGLLEGLFTQAGGRLREKDKEDLRNRCLEAARKPIGRSIGWFDTRRQATASRYAHRGGRYLQQSRLLGVIAAPKNEKAALEKKLSRTITKTLELMQYSRKFLKSEGQRGLLTAMLEMLSNFFPAGHGVIDESGKVTRNSVRARIEATVSRPGAPPSMPFMYQVQLFLSHQKSDFAAGDHRQLFQVRSLIRLYVGRLAGRTANEVAGVAIHEMVHMMVSLRQSLEARAGQSQAGIFPTKKAAAILDLRKFAGHRQVLEQHFSNLLDYLRREHGVDVFSAIADRTPASLMAEMAVEEVLAHLFRAQVSLAFAEAEAERTSARTKRSAVAIATGFVPLQFLKNYLRHHWIKGVRGSGALKTPRAEKILKNMGADLLKLVSAMESHLAAS